MVPNKSLDVQYRIIAALLHDVQKTYADVFNTRALRLTLDKVRWRADHEGTGFFTKSLPRLGKAFDRALQGEIRMNSVESGFEPADGCEFPRFLGELFSRVFHPDGALLSDPCTKCVRVIRDILFLFYKYELPYTEQQEQQVISRFKQTETDLSTHWLDNRPISRVNAARSSVSDQHRLELFDEGPEKDLQRLGSIARGARRLLSELFAHFDPLMIHPRHGPGAVATKQKLWEKYRWENVAEKLTDVYPYDAYFCASNGHVCDAYDGFNAVNTQDLPARVLLVPKDSRGPRLISCEPVDKQWVQQGLGRAVVELVEQHPLTKWNVHFTDQAPNQRGALLGSITGGYATLDLNEASDRVALDLVRGIFPLRLIPYLEACRSCSTVLPSGEELQLLKFAPMGSALCFPILALTIWSLLTAGAPDADTRDGILVYGDDVIVPTAYAENAMNILESFGLRINQDKSCTKGFFRESCGVDAFKGADVTPVRIRTVWSSHPHADLYSSWIAYANSFYDRGYYHAYNEVVSWLVLVYGTIPGSDTHLVYRNESKETVHTVPTLRGSTEGSRPLRARTNKRLQRRELYVWALKAPVIVREMEGWNMLLRYFAEASTACPLSTGDTTDGEPLTGPRVAVSTGNEVFLMEDSAPFSVSRYTNRKTSMLVKRWR